MGDVIRALTHVNAVERAHPAHLVSCEDRAEACLRKCRAVGSGCVQLAIHGQRDVLRHIDHARSRRGVEVDGTRSSVDLVVAARGVDRAHRVGSAPHGDGHVGSRFDARHGIRAVRHDCAAPVVCVVPVPRRPADPQRVGRPARRGADKARCARERPRAQAIFDLHALHRSTPLHVIVEITPLESPSVRTTSRRRRARPCRSRRSGWA